MLLRPSAARPAPSPPASPPFRRPLAWSRRLWCAWWGGSCSRARWPPLRRRSGRLGRWPRSPVRPRDGLARGLCALPARPRLASGRLLGRWPQRLPWRGAELGCSFRGGLPPFPRRARLRALPPSPRRVRLTAHTRAEIIAGDGGRALVPRACGAVGCARGARPCIPAVSAVCLPASGRARSACRAVCAVRALRRASPPSSGGQVRALKGFTILQREHRGDGHAPPALRSPPDGGDLAVAMQKSPRSDQKRGFIRRASGRRGMGHSIQRWRRSAYSAANSRRIRLQARPRTPCGTCRICHPADTGRPRSLSQSGKSSESGARRLPFCASPLSAISSLLVAIPSRARPLPCCPHRPTPVYTGRGWGSKHFLSFFALKNRWLQSSARRRSSARQRALFPALGAP